MPTERLLVTKQLALKVIEEYGPLSARELADQLGISCPYGRAIVSYWKKRKAIYISAYRRDTDGGALYPRGLYAVGNHVDARKPKPLSRLEYSRRHRHNKKMVACSVFTLAIPVDDRRLTNRKRPDAAERLRKAANQPVD